MKTDATKHFQEIHGLTLDDSDIIINDDPEICPECGTRTITLDEDKCEEYCTRCGYVTRAASRYVAGEKINLPYGLIII